MKILITTLGSRGDVQIYVALAVALQKRSHAVTVQTNEAYRDLVERYSIPFLPINRKESSGSEEFSEIQKQGKNNGLKQAMDFLFQGLEESYSHIEEHCRDYDLMIGHGYFGETQADKHGLPFIRSVISDTLAEKSAKLTGNPLEKIGITMEKAVVKSLILDRYDAFRMSHGAPILSSMPTEKPILLPLSEAMVNRSRAWTKNNHLTGFWYLEELESYVPSKDLTEFLERGERPFIVSFGSLADAEDNIQDSIKMFIRAFEESGERAILCGWKDHFEGIEIPDSIYQIDEIPFSWLFPHGKCVIHHCGLGTTAQALQSGIPSIPVPHIIDQITWAKKIYNAGAALRPIPAGKLNHKRLVNAIGRLKQESSLSAAAKDLAERISREDGVSTACDFIEKYYSELANDQRPGI